jgi:hypothetical protein
MACICAARAAASTVAIVIALSAALADLPTDEEPGNAEHEEQHVAGCVDADRMGGQRRCRTDCEGEDECDSKPDE